jgi:hypothetical protein
MIRQFGQTDFFNRIGRSLSVVTAARWSTDVLCDARKLYQKAGFQLVTALEKTSSARLGHGASGGA